MGVIDLIGIDHPKALIVPFAELNINQIIGGFIMDLRNLYFDEVGYDLGYPQTEQQRSLQIAALERFLNKGLRLLDELKGSKAMVQPVDFRPAPKATFQTQHYNYGYLPITDWKPINPVTPKSVELSRAQEVIRKGTVD